MRVFFLAFLASLPVSTLADAKPSGLKYSLECVLQAVSLKMNIPLRADVPLPKLMLESETSLEQFQDAVQEQWGGKRPEAFLNAYVAARNEIYLIDDEAFYLRNGRFVEDSLAHELAHYMQVKYQRIDLLPDDDSVELDAIFTQTWVREQFLAKGLSPCASNSLR